MNNQPLNLLTTTNVNNEQMVPPSTRNEQNRQMALASIFSSLSSLASTNTQSIDHNSINISELNNHAHQLQLQQQRTTPTSLASTQQTLQSVMAAAMQQQQQLSLATNLQPLTQTHQNQSSPIPAINFLTDNQNSLFNQQELQQQMNNNQQQRINYCTICNKELCNKYFMKTHMIKMHGINLEMEQAEDEDEVDGDDNNQNRHNDNDLEQQQQDTRQPIKNDVIETPNRPSWSPSNFKTKTSAASHMNKQNTNQQQQHSTAKKKPTMVNNNSSNNNNNNNKQTTSVMNGFAGNSMGGVVCDICNKELCSKYFLKVHKQNTHGIADYQDSACQFAMYPFTGSIGGPSPFIPAPVPPALPQTFSPFALTNPMNLFSNQNHKSSISDSSDSANTSSNNQAKKTNAKRPRLSGNQKNQQSSSSIIDKQNEDLNSNETNNSESSHKQQIDSVYRLLLAQQQQQQQLTQQPPIPTAASLMGPMDPMAAAFSAAGNPLSALMCFGTMGPMTPFGPAGMSPASIVDNILRNQHLFNRNHSNNQQNSSSSNQSTTKTFGTDGNNNSDSNKTQSKGSKDSANNSRYFSHYTEACPMCDRRFKSIKWLKTHMMNDHKQEIGAYMQMMMQYLYNSKSQQMAAAATMAALEQQQQQLTMNHRQQSLLQHLNSQNVQNQQESSSVAGQPSNLSNKCQNMDFSQSQQQQQPNKATDMILNQLQLKKSYQFPRVRNSPESIFEQSNFVNQQSNSLSIDARCRNESLSPDESNIEQSPSPNIIQPSNASNTNELVCGLNFQIENLDQNEHLNKNKFLLSATSLENESDSGEDVTQDSDSQQDEQQFTGQKATGLGSEVNQSSEKQRSIKAIIN